MHGFPMQAMAWAAFNGAGLALVLPCAQSVLADYYIPEQRGRAFGFMFTLAALGEALCRADHSPLWYSHPCRSVSATRWDHVKTRAVKP